MVAHVLFLLVLSTPSSADAMPFRSIPAISVLRDINPTTCLNTTAFYSYFPDLFTCTAGVKGPTRHNTEPLSKRLAFKQRKQQRKEGKVPLSRESVYYKF